MQLHNYLALSAFIIGTSWAFSVQAETGEELYQSTCQVCHATGLANAPKVGDKTAWDQLESKGMDELMHSAINGKGAMPPRGGSKADDETIRAAIEYMLKHSS